MTTKTKRLFEFFFVLTLVSAFVSWNTHRQESEAEPTPSPGTIERWDQLYKQGNEHLKSGEFEKAIVTLTEAADVALTLPVGDQRLAETYDDLGLAFFMSKDTAKAKELQGKAVAALLLSQGPGAKDLNLFVERYEYASGEKYDPQARPFYTFLATHPPYGGERFELELNTLVSRYQKLGDISAVDYLKKL